MRMSDWSSDVCSSDLLGIEAGFGGDHAMWFACEPLEARNHFAVRNLTRGILILDQAEICTPARIDRLGIVEELFVVRSEEHTSELQSLMRTSYAVFCLKKKRYAKLQCTYIHNKR